MPKPSPRTFPPNPPDRRGYRGRLDGGIARLEGILRDAGLSPVPSVGNFIYADTGGDAGELYGRLLHEGVIVRPLAGFGSPTAIRVTVGTAEELDFFAAALGRILQPA